MIGQVFINSFFKDETSDMFNEIVKMSLFFMHTKEFISVIFVR